MSNTSVCVPHDHAEEVLRRTPLEVFGMDVSNYEIHSLISGYGNTADRSMHLWIADAHFWNASTQTHRYNEQFRTIT